MFELLETWCSMKITCFILAVRLVCYQNVVRNVTWTEMLTRASMSKAGVERFIILIASEFVLDLLF